MLTARVKAQQTACDC